MNHDKNRETNEPTDPTITTTDTVLYSYAVGDLLVPETSTWEETTHFTLSDGQAIVTLAWPTLGVHEVAAVDHGPLQFALYAEDDQILLFLKLGAASRWLELPFTIWRVLPEERVLPPLPAPIADSADSADTAETAPLTPPPHALILTFLVQAETGRIAAMRACTISAEMTRALYVAIHAQVAQGYDADGYDARLDALRERYLTPDAFVADTTVVRLRCAGGD